MISFTYKILRDEGDEQKSFSPKIPQPLPNLSCIEGPNSSGKSTLLNLIALGCFGMANKRIHASLSDKMRSLLESRHQRVEFAISISDSEGKKVLEMEKGLDSNKISVFETVKGQRRAISQDDFTNRYTLIYDVPDNPIGRVKELARELGDEQHLLGSRVTQFRHYIHDVLDGIENAFDPSRVGKLEAQVAGISNDIEATIAAKEALEREREWLEKYFRAKSFLELESVVKQLADSRQQLEKDVRDVSRTQSRTAKDLGQLEKETKRAFEEIHEKLSDLTTVLRQLLPSDSRYFEAWGKGLWKDELLTAANEGPLDDGIAHYEKQLNALQKKASKTSGMDEAKFFGKLLETLRNFQDFKLVVPGVNKEIKPFIAIIEKKFAECQEYALLSANLARAEKLVDELKDLRRTFVKETLPRIKKIKPTNSTSTVVDGERSGDDAARAQLLRLRERLQEADLRYSHIRQECKRLQLPESDMKHFVASFEKSVKEVRPYVAHKDGERESVLVAHQKQINQKDAEVRLQETRKRMLESEVEQLKGKRAHPYQADVEHVKALFEKLQVMEQRIHRRYDAYLAEVIGGTADTSATGEKAAYFEQLWRYLGRRVRVVRHGEKEYAVEKIDLANAVILAPRGKLIHLSDMGTGQGQAAYLKGILNKQDKKRIVALIDEVAMMDSESLRPIRESLRKLYKESRLLVGIIVQRGDELRISDI